MLFYCRRESQAQRSQEVSVQWHSMPRFSKGKCHTLPVLCLCQRLAFDLLSLVLCPSDYVRTHPQNGCCRRGDACPFAHGVFECWLHPQRYRTQLCADGTACKRRVCFFAHVEVIRVPLPVLRMFAALCICQRTAGLIYPCVCLQSELRKPEDAAPPRSANNEDENHLSGEPPRRSITV